MSDNQDVAGQQPVGPTLKDVEAVRDLFARAHDYIAQATYPGHMGMKVAEVLNFLAFQYNDFKLRAEKLMPAKQPVAVPSMPALAERSYTLDEQLPGEPKA